MVDLFHQSFLSGYLSILITILILLSISFFQTELIQGKISNNFTSRKTEYQYISIHFYFTNIKLDPLFNTCLGREMRTAWIWTSFCSSVRGQCMQPGTTMRRSKLSSIREYSSRTQSKWKQVSKTSNPYKLENNDCGLFDSIRKIVVSKLLN